MRLAAARWVIYIAKIRIKPLECKLSDNAGNKGYIFRKRSLKTLQHKEIIHYIGEPCK